MSRASCADSDPVSLRVGIDLVSVASVRDALTSHRDRYLRRVYTDAEVADCRRAADVDPMRLAARFAAKEAVMKILRPPPDEGVPWRSIAVRRQGPGAPVVELDGVAAGLAHRQGIRSVSVSLTHEGDYAGAVAVAQAGGGS